MPKPIATRMAKGIAIQNDQSAMPYSPAEVSSPTVYAPTAKKATKPRSSSPAMPSVMFSPKPINAYSAMSAITEGMKPVKPSGNMTTISSRKPDSGMTTAG